MNTPGLQAGEGKVDITPPLGIELAGFHKPPGQERKITGIRQPANARALFLRLGKEQAGIVVLDLLAFRRISQSACKGKRLGNLAFPQAT